MQMLAIALLFPEPISEKIDELRIRYGTPRVRAVVPHITLKQPFSATVEIGVILERLRSVAEKMPPFSVLLKRFEYFETERTMVYIAIDDSIPVLDLHSQIVHSLHGLTEGGDEYELDKFVPHISLNDEIPKDCLSSYKSELSAFKFNIEAVLNTFVLFSNDGTEWKHAHLFQLTGH
jgi:2'-5' RNA ligase